MEPGQPALAALRSAFGATVINESDGTLNRAELGRLAFATPEKTKVLNKITHGAIRRRMVWKLIGYWVRGYKVVVVDTPLLVEADYGSSVASSCSSTAVAKINSAACLRATASPRASPRLTQAKARSAAPARRQARICRHHP